MACSALVLFSGFVALGTWQLQRRAWKLDLISRVTHRVGAPAVPAPEAAQWAGMSAAADEYRHVTVNGTFLNEAETPVQAATALGAGYWILTPLRLVDGSLILVNRGFVPPKLRDRPCRAATEPAGTTQVIGLVRMSEPRGAFLRHNDPAASRWYSRDVAAIAAAHGLKRVAPYFIDADAAEIASGGLGAGSAREIATFHQPVGGLTVVAFHNNHLMYAFTWYTLALMVVGGSGLVIREQHRMRRLE